MKQRAVEPLRSVLAACDELIARVGNITLDAYLNDRDVQLIAERLIIAVGDTMNRAARIDDTLLDAIPDARRSIEARNRIAHGYADIRNDIVWDIAVRNIPRLRNELANVLDAEPAKDRDNVEIPPGTPDVW